MSLAMSLETGLETGLAVERKPAEQLLDFIALSLGHSLDGVRKTTPYAINYYETCMVLCITIVGKSRCPFEFDRATVGKISDALPHELISLY